MESSGLSLLRGKRSVVIVYKLYAGVVVYYFDAVCIISRLDKYISPADYDIYIRLTAAFVEDAYGIISVPKASAVFYILKVYSVFYPVVEALDIFVYLIGNHLAISESYDPVGIEFSQAFLVCDEYDEFLL